MLSAIAPSTLTARSSRSPDHNTSPSAVANRSRPVPGLEDGGRPTTPRERQLATLIPMSSLFGLALRGAVAGGVGTVLMDLATTSIQKRQSRSDADREAAARPNGKQAVENLVDRVAGGLGTQLDEQSRTATMNVVHYGLGVAPGVLYALLRCRVPLLGAGHGLVYGALLWAVNDELANTVLGLAGPPEAYPMSSHARGLAGHLVLGVGTDVGIDLIGLVG